VRAPLSKEIESDREWEVIVYTRDRTVATAHIDGFTYPAVKKSEFLVELKSEENFVGVL